MKKFLLFLLALLLLIPSCANNASGDPQDETAEDTRILLAENGTPLYTVVCPEKGDVKTEAAAQAVQEGLCALTEAAFVLADDWVDRDSDPDTISEYEILVGDTNRSASSLTPENAGSDGWWVIVDGKRIVVNAVSSWSLAEAAEYALSLCTFEEGKLYLNTEGCQVEQRENMLAESSPTLRVGTYNIHNGGDVGHDFSVLAEELIPYNLDVIGLQEVDRNANRSQKQDTPKVLAEKLGFGYHEYTAAFPHDGGEYGTAILSRYPILEYETIRLTVAPGEEVRAMGHAVIDVNGAHIDVFNTHLTVESESTRLIQLDEIAKAAAGLRGFVVTADFNTNKLPSFKVFGDYHLVNNGRYATFPASRSAIDNIVVDKEWKIVDSGIGEWKNSDHCLLWAELKYQAE